MFFTIEKIEKYLNEIQSASIRTAVDIHRFKYLEGLLPSEGYEPHCPEYDDSDWADFELGNTWGGRDVQAWFRAWVDLPPAPVGCRQALRFLVGLRDDGSSAAESLLYVNGFPLQAIDGWHEQAWLSPELAASGKLLVALHAWSGILGAPDRRRFKLAQLISIDETAEQYCYLARTLLDSVRLLDQNDLRRVRLLELLEASFRRVDFFKPRSENFYGSLSAAASILDEGLASLRSKELKPCVTALGHSHIDMAWLWRLAHTRQKAARTFSTVLNLMRRYPEFQYMHSSPQLYKFLKDDYPEIYDQVKRRIAEGRWEITGGMWVEADTNLTGGESLIRQFLFGRRFIRDEFRQPTNILWLPDVFGYSAALPQIARKCGIRYFLTSKISWSQFNRFPYDTFRWRGIDGTEILTHFITTPDPSSWYYTYNGQLAPAQVKGIWDNYRQKEVNDNLLLLFGWGDGGGGPTQEMLEAARALKDVPGLPRLEIGSSEAYFAQLEARLEGRSLPVWDGELYLEYHRGTYTSQGFIKRANRKAEILYHEAEWLSSLACTLGAAADYPREDLNRGWERILLNQFHDILPGSSIREVYDDCRRDYARIYRIGEEALGAARASLLSELQIDSPSLVAFNSLSWDRSGLVELSWDPAFVSGNLPVQVIESDGEKKHLVELDAIPALGYAVVPYDGESEQEALLPDEEDAIFVTPDLLQNANYRIRLNKAGQIVSLYDRRSRREVLAEGERANVLLAFEDKPLNFDAWDIDIYYQDKQCELTDLVEAVVEETGPLRGVLRLSWRFGDSLITQRLTIYRRSPRIDFRTQVDWHESQVLLKAAFPVAVRASRATYEVQFGSVERPTHWNTSWDYARFEVPAHKWADLSEGGCGVALLNDCKYGCDIKGSTMRLTLIKSGIDPDPTADQGEHYFTYSLLPHQGDWRQGGVVKEAYDLNYPLHAALISSPTDGRLPSTARFVGLECDHAIIETVKKAEDSEAWIVRIYEYQQSRSQGNRLVFDRGLLQAYECNLVEEEEEEEEEDTPAVFDRDSLTFDLLPFEIKTFKIFFETRP
jgi:alpha-mannosidase